MHINVWFVTEIGFWWTFWNFFRITNQSHGFSETTWL